MPNTIQPGVWRDRGMGVNSPGGWEMDGKDILMKNGARLIPRSVSIFEHFMAGAGALNSNVPQNFVTTENGAATPFAPGAAALSGLAVAVTGGTTNNAEELAGKNVGWKPSTMATNRPMVLEVRAKFVGTTTATDGDFYIGFADVVLATSGLAYVITATSTVTSTGVTEFAGIGYSSIPSSGALFSTVSGANGNFHGIFSTKATVAATPISTGIVKDSSFHIYRVELDSLANARFFIDDVAVGAVQAATTAATALTPYVGAIAKNSHTHTATIDYVFVGADLV